MVVHVENSIESTKTLLEPINEFSNITRQKANIQKSTVFLYTGNKLSEPEIKTKQCHYTTHNACEHHLQYPQNGLRYKSWEICARSVSGKLKNIDERNKI